MSRPQAFDELVNYLIEQNKKLGEGTHNKSQRPWLDLQELKGGPVGNFDVEALYKKIDRTEANQLYVTAWNKDKPLEHEVVVPKLAENFMAGVTRDFIDCRKRSRIRMMVHTGTRERADGVPVRCALYRHTIGFLTAIEQAKKVGPPEDAAGTA